MSRRKYFFEFQEKIYHDARLMCYPPNRYLSSDFDDLLGIQACYLRNKKLWVSEIKELKKR